MKKIFLLLTAGIIIGTLCGCATVMRDNSQAVSIKANTEKVNIKILDKKQDVVFEGITPTVLNLKTSQGGYFDPEKYTVIASKDGYKEYTTIVDWHVSKWYSLGNLVIGGLIGYLLVDPITGDMYYLDENVFLNMDPEGK